MSKLSFTKEDAKKLLIYMGSLIGAIIFWMILSRFDAIKGFVEKILDAASPIIIGCVIAFLLNPVMNLFREIAQKILSAIFRNHSGKKLRKAANAIGVFATVIFLILIITAFLVLVIPSLQDSIITLYNNFPGYLDNVKNWINDFIANNEDLSNMIEEYLNRFETNFETVLADKVMPNIDTLLSTVSNGIIGGISALFDFVVGIIVAVYILASKDKLLAQAKKIIYCIFKKNTGNKILDVFSYINNVFSGFINGKIIDSVIIGILCGIFCAIVHMPYAALIAVIVGVTNVIPVFGPFIGAIPSALLILVADPKMAVMFIIFIIILQQVDGNIIGPMIIGDSTGLSAFWVLVAITLGGSLYGVMGMLLAVPVFACIYALIKYLVENGLRKRGIDEETEYFTNVKRFDEDGNPVALKDEDITEESAKRFKESIHNISHKREELISAFKGDESESSADDAADDKEVKD